MIIQTLKNIPIFYRFLNLELKVKSVLSILVLLVNTILDVAGISLVIPLIGKILIDSHESQVFLFEFVGNFSVQLLCIIIALIFLMKLMFGIFMYFWLNNFMADVKNNIQTSLLSVVLSSNQKVESTFADSQLKQIIFSEVNIFHLRFLVPLYTLLVELILVLFFLLFLLLLSPYITLLVVLFFASIFIIIRRLTSVELVSLGEKRKILDEKILDETVNNVDGKEEIFANEYGRQLMQNFERSLLIFKKVVVKQLAILQIPRLVYECALVLCVCVVMYFHAFIALDINELAETLLLYVGVASRVLPSINRITNSVQNIATAQKSCSDIVRILNISMEGSVPNVKARTNTLSDDIIASVKDVEITLGADSYRIKFPNFEFKKNDKLCITGASGSGKSSLMKLLLCINRPSSGILYSKLRNSSFPVAYVPQKPILFHETVTENILMGRGYNKGLFRDVCEIAEIDFLSNSGEIKVNKLSGGQKQRIAIARSLYGMPKVLLLDESTNAVSSQQAQKIIQKLLERRPNLSLLMITHDDSITKLFEKCVQLHAVTLKTQEE